MTTSTHSDSTSTDFSIEIKAKPKAKPLPCIPTYEELVYKIYDTQRDIIAGIKPIQSECKVPFGIDGIRKITDRYDYVYFDGIHKDQAREVFYSKGLASGITNDEVIPYITAKEIIIYYPSVFGNIPLTKFDTIDGIKYMVYQTNVTFINMINSRSLINSLSYMLNLEYNCNLHLNEEAYRIALTGGLENIHSPHRFLFNAAATRYTNPEMLPLLDFIRSQVFEMRGLSDQAIHEFYVNNLHDIDTLKTKHEINMAVSIYNGEYKNFVGYFGDDAWLINQFVKS